MDSIFVCGNIRRLALGAAVVALVLAMPLRADIRDTKHNLAQRLGYQVTDEREVCVFCHFPAIADAPGATVPAASAEAPLWQRTVADGYSFSIYDDIGRVGLDGATPVGSQSMACLACHDSNQAFVVAGGLRDHPFGVPYRGNRASQQSVDAAKEAARSAATPMRERQFAYDFGADGYRPVFESVVENRRIFWASSTNNGYRRGKSDLPLYGRKAADGGEDVPFIECTSCHDPHSTSRMFLRVSSDNSLICMTCHDK